MHLYTPETGSTWPDGLDINGYAGNMVRYAKSTGTPVMIGECGELDPGLNDDPMGTYLIPLINVLDSSGADLISIWDWYFNPSAPESYVTGSNYPVVMQRIDQFNAAYANRTYGASNRAACDAAAVAASPACTWVLWGRVAVSNSNEFTIDDGSGNPIQVIFTNHGLVNGDFATVSGTLDTTLTPPVLTAAAVSKINQ